MARSISKAIDKECKAVEKKAKALLKAAQAEAAARKKAREIFMNGETVGAGYITIELFGEKVHYKSDAHALEDVVEKLMTFDSRSKRAVATA